MAKADQIATSGTAKLAAYCLLAPYDNYNEGQKILIDNYTYLDVDVTVDTDAYFVPGIGFVFEYETTSIYVDVSGYVEEAFGSLYDDTQEICEAFAEEAFNGFAAGSFDEVVEQVYEDWEDAYEIASRKIAVFS